MKRIVWYILICSIVNFLFYRFSVKESGEGVIAYFVVLFFSLFAAFLTGVAIYFIKSVLGHPTMLFYFTGLIYFVFYLLVWATLFSYDQFKQEQYVLRSAVISVLTTYFIIFAFNFIQRNWNKTINI